MPPSLVLKSCVLCLLRPKQHPPDEVAVPRQRLGMNVSLNFCRDAAVVPKTMYMKRPGVVPGMKRNMVSMARPALRSGAGAFASWMLLSNAVIWNKVLVTSKTL